MKDMWVLEDVGKYLGLGGCRIDTQSLPPKSVKHTHAGTKFIIMYKVTTKNMYKSY